MNSRSECRSGIFLFLRCGSHRDEDIGLHLDNRTIHIFSNPSAPCAVDPQVPPVHNDEGGITCYPADAARRISGHYSESDAPYTEG